jgi:hypothetical protein
VSLQLPSGWQIEPGGHVLPTHALGIHKPLAFIARRAARACAAVDARPPAANLGTVALDDRARVEARAGDAKLTDGANGAHARVDAVTVDAFGAIVAIDAYALRVDAQPLGRVTSGVAGALELTIAAFGDARAIAANFAGVANRVAIVGRSIAIVVEAVAYLVGGADERNALQHAVLALIGSDRANPGLAGLTRAAASRTGNAGDERGQIVEVVVTARDQIFPPEVESVRGDGAVVDQ